MGARVAELMTTEVITADRTTTLDTIAAKMVENGVSSLVITNQGSPYGIVTESDFVSAAHRIDRPFAEIPVHTVTSHPLVTIEPDLSIRLAVERMRTERVKKLVVVDGLDVRGIVTTSDIVDHYGELAREINAVRERGRRKESSWFDS